MWNQGGWPHYGHMGYGGGYWMMGLGSVLWLIFLVVLIVGAVVLIRYLWHGGAPYQVEMRQRSRSSDSLAILEARYARGEIDRNEFLQKKQDLTGGS